MGRSGGSLQVPQNSLNSKKGPEQDREKASLARLSWFGSAAVGRCVFGSAAVTLSYTRVRVGCFKESGCCGGGSVCPPAPDPSRSPRHHLHLKHWYRVQALHCYVESYPAVHLHIHKINLRQVGFSVNSAKNINPSEKFSTDGAHLCYRMPVQFMWMTGSPISRDSAARASRELPPSWAGVDVVCPLLPLEVVFYNITVSLLVNAFWQNMQNLGTIKHHKKKKV